MRKESERMKNLKKHSESESRNRIRKVEEMLKTLPVTPDTYSYIKMYQVIQELHYQGKYQLTCKLCNVLLNN